MEATGPSKTQYLSTPCLEPGGSETYVARVEGADRRCAPVAWSAGGEGNPWGAFRCERSR